MRSRSLTAPRAPGGVRALGIPTTFSKTPRCGRDRGFAAAGATRERGPRRYGRTVAELQEMLDAQGFVGRVLGKTPTDIRGAGRGDEIAVWLAEHAVDGYVIIDDHADMGELRSHLVQTHPARGLQPADVPRALAALTNPGGR